LKAERPDVLVITDVCLCGYTSHGHCGILTKSGEIENDATIERLARMSEVMPPRAQTWSRHRP
jgi:porphobilinogen synthase